MSYVSLVESFRRNFGYQFPAMGILAFRSFFRLMPDIVETELLPDIKARLDLRDLTARTTYWQGKRFEHPTPAILSEWGQSADLFFDIGSNYGFFSYWLYTSCPKLSIHSFEPNPLTFGRLQDIVTNNKLKRIQPHHLALSDANGEFMLTPGKVDSGHSTLGINPELEGQKGVPVQVHTFDAWRRSANIALPLKPSWIVKMDVEGFELKVLTGMQEALRAKAFLGLAVEINDYTLGFCGTSAKEVHALLRDHGYRPLNDTPDSARWPLHKTANAFFVPA